MLTKVTLPLIYVAAGLQAVVPVPSYAQPIVLSPGLSRLSGTDASSRIEYVRFFLDGTLLSASSASAAAKEPKVEASVPASATGGSAAPAPSTVAVAASGPASNPMLIAQCTRNPSGKLAFELLANFGGVEDLAYYPPWRPADSRDLFPPQLQKLNITMEFVGYTHVKPVKRQWEALLQPVGQYRYNPPSGGSSNMEDSMYYLRFMLALPTLRLTLGDKTAEFHTAPLLDQIRREPLCKASLL